MQRSAEARKLEKAMTAYFSGISRLVPVTEQVATGQKDEDGHMIFKAVGVKNRLGKVVKTEDWLIPPSIADLQHALGLTEGEWAALKGREETRELCEAAEKRVERYLRRELLTRPNKAVKGVLMTLQEDFGFGAAEAAAESGGSLEELLG